MNKDGVGAVMVVGAGIAGMQASLDLADQGFKVYLVESKSAIGGRMAQLDKTFPTNDCAMCTISPKLVETGRHPNIEVMTNSELFEVSGQAGGFTTLVRRKPRYVDVTKCVGCADCVQVCPVITPDTFNEGLDERRAIFRLYPQAFPNAFAIEKRGVSPCRDACPAGQRAQGYIALIREGRWQDAMRVIKLDNPFPGICGRICIHRCEDACNRALVDEPINIRALKRFVTDKVYAEPRQTVEACTRTEKQKIAIIGAGPCGLTAAQDLVMAGYGVTVFEAMPVAGGMLRLGVPEYRLPTEIIEREVQDILDLGVDLKLNHRIDDLDDVFEQGFDAVLIAVGAHEGIRLPIPGAKLEGVLINTHFLRDVRLGRYGNEVNGSVTTPDGKQFGPRVLVLGGGNVAIDCARSAVRLGGEVHLACLEGSDTMPAHPAEILAAEEEGVTFHLSRSFERILGDVGGKVTGVECQEVASFRFDESGNLSVDKVPGSHHVIPCDTVIFSVGQRAGLAFIPDDAGVGLTDLKTIAVNPNTLSATRAGVFAAGDSVSGTAFVIEAVASGHTAASSIIRYLHGQRLEPEPESELPVVELGRHEIEGRIARGEIHRRPRVAMPELPISQRISSFAEVERGYDEESAQLEAARCLACGICSECMSCTFVCGTDAILHEDVEEREAIEVGAIVLAPGFRPYQAEKSEELGYGRFPNVLSSIQFERMLSASGPTMGHLKRPSDGKTPRRLAFLQCVGSRDQTHDYCSSVCCMYATKEAMIAKEHEPELDVQIFQMDLRAFSKGYWQYFERARDRYGIKYTRCRISSIQQDPVSGDLTLSYLDGAGQPQQAAFDMVVLSVGMEISADVQDLCRQIGVDLDDYGFCATDAFHPLETSRPGIYAVGPFREPKDIPESVVEASAAASAAAERISGSRFTLTEEVTFPLERKIDEEDPRIGVFVCHCGSNIAGFLDVEQVKGFAGDQPQVVLSECNLYTCSQDSVHHITEQVKEHDLNRVVVASCTPLTHQPLFRESIREAGLNPYLFEMANIRNQCSWIHSDDREEATLKAKQLVAMAISRAALLEPQPILTVPVVQAALVIGGGLAGMTAALSLAAQGFEVELVEREQMLGGNLRRVHIPRNGVDPQELLRRTIHDVERDERIRVHLGAEVSKTSGFMGNFASSVRNAAGEVLEIRHGVAILATGGQEYRGPDYGHTQDERVITQMDFESLLKSGSDLPKSVAMIQCVGPAVDYCSRICCTTALKNALALKSRNSQAQIVVFHRDIRAYGFKERMYTQARESGIVFVRYDPERPPAVDHGAQLTVTCMDHDLRQPVAIKPDLLVLSMPVVPQPDARELATMFKVPVDSDGFFLEAHVKLRPVDFACDGVFMAGASHYPKLADETIVQAKAAAARAARILSRETLDAGGQVAVVDESRCTGCLTCVRICPFEVPRMHYDRIGVGGISGAASIEAAVCQGCGICVAECPAQAIELHHYTDRQIQATASALIREVR